MTAISCTERFQERTSPETITLQASEGGGLTAKVVRTHTRTFRVVTNNKFDDGFIAMQHYLIPKPFDPHPTDPTCSVRKRTPKPLAGDKAWLITVEYSSEVPDPSEQDENPLLRPVKQWLTFEETKVPLYVDDDGNPVVNTAGVAYDPPIEITSQNIIYNYERNEAYHASESTIAGYINHLNSSSFSGKAPRYVRCRKFKPDEQREKNLTYYKVNYEFEYNPFGFDPRPLSRGVLQLDGIPKKLVRIKDKQGRDITSPIPLDEDGYALEPDDVLNNPNLLHYQHFKGLAEADFGDLNLPQYWGS